MGEKLAIIIPAYKTRFLRKTLDSVAKQSCREFTVYVGDDASLEDIGGIVRSYSKELNIVYHRFECNLGRKDLPGHWDRCISLSTEPLIWLFSDDDIMPSDGVERVLEALRKYNGKPIFMRLPLMVVDADGKMVYKNPPFETKQISGYELLLDKLTGKISSAACEYVFSRDVWRQMGGFVKFPMAWCSDDATWVGFANYAGGVISLLGNPVCWRNAAGTNICNSACFDKEKLRATALFIRWIREHCTSHVKERRLQEALSAYIHTVLSRSVRYNFTLLDLGRICSILGDFSYAMALQVAFRHIFKTNLFRRK
ncbi:glycosyltransferase family A protein [Bacteroides helcogenes]|nr:glycosyltransferase family A protein [Bacteroides helcogenes]MDY5237675.1 glycosyltransferase family A protein [Bacteroides helcogenes]